MKLECHLADCFIISYLKTLTYTIQKLKKVIGYVKVPVVVIALLVAGIYVLTKVTPLTVAIGYGTTTKTAPATFSPAAGSEVQTGSEKIAYGFVPSAMASLPSDERIAALNKMKQAGFSQVRVNFNWNFMEPVQGRYVWSGTDSFMKQISDAGLLYRSTIRQPGTGQLYVKPMLFAHR